MLIAGWVGSCAGGYSQNLVMNGDFETIGGCSGYPGNIPMALYYSSGNMGTPDYFHSCNTGLLTQPVNFAGQQQPLSGEGYGGLAYLDPGFSETVQCRLSERLLYGREYCFVMAISPAEDVTAKIDKLSVYFSIDSVKAGDFPTNSAGLVPQIDFDIGNVRDTVNWTLLEASYIASGDEQYFLVGNFDANIAWLDVDTTAVMPDMFTYYYLDDLQLFSCDDSPVIYAEPLIPNVITVNGDGINDRFFIRHLQPGTVFLVYDRWGLLQYESRDYQNDWDGSATSGEQLDEGTYYCLLQSPDGRTYSSFFHVFHTVQ